MTVKLDGDHIHSVCLNAADACDHSVEEEFRTGNGRKAYTKCLVECPANTYLSGKKCVSACPVSNPTYDADNVCRACDAEKDAGEFWNQMTKKCVGACPEGSNLPDSEIICGACEHYFDEANNKCVDECEFGADADGRVCNQAAECG